MVFPLLYVNMVWFKSG